MLCLKLVDCQGHQEEARYKKPTGKRCPRRRDDQTHVGSRNKKKDLREPGKKPDTIWALVNNCALEPAPGCYKCQKGKLDKGYTGTLCTIFATFL